MYTFRMTTPPVSFNPLNIVSKGAVLGLSLASRLEEKLGFPLIEFEVTAQNQKEISDDDAGRILMILREFERGRPAEDYSPFHKKKDRYTDVLQYTATMVPVFDEQNQKIDFNGAQFVTGNKNYILMQGPKESTVDLTKMVMTQNDVKQIVCLTPVLENDKVKCECYWFGWKTEEREGFFIRTPRKSDGWTPDIMFHCEVWPDQGVLADIEPFIQLIKEQRARYQGGAIAVHCSAGVGRSGVFMVATLMMDLMDQGARVLNPVQLMTQIREVRPAMVQTRDQLKFCFKVANYLLQNRL